MQSNKLQSRKKERVKQYDAVQIINDFVTYYLSDNTSSYDLGKQYYDETHLALILSSYQDLLTELEANDSEKYREYFFYKWISEMPEQKKYKLWKALSDRGYHKSFEDFLKESEEKKIEDDAIAMINMLCNEEKV